MTRGILLSITVLGLLSILMFLLSFIVRRRYSKDPDTPRSAIKNILEAMELTASDHFLDLGAGDYRVVKEAAKFCRSSGVELSPLHILIGRFPSKHRHRTIGGSLFRINLSEYTKIYANLDRRLVEAVSNKDRFTKGTKLFLMNDELPDLKPHKKHVITKDITLSEYQF